MVAKITEFQNKINSLASSEFEELVCVVYGEMFKRKKGFRISHLGKEFSKSAPIRHPVDIEISYIDESNSIHRVLIAVSNQQTGLYSKQGKLSKDCLSILKYIKDNDIANVEIIAVYSKNPTEKENFNVSSLKVTLQQEKIVLSLVNAETLNFYINEYCPSVYKDFLGLNIYSGGITYLEDHLDKKLGDYYKFELLGREHELTELQKLLPQKRCLLIRGHSGCGKTRLAIELAKTIFESGYKCLWVESSSFSSINDFDAFYERNIKIIVVIDDINKIPFLNSILQKILFYENTYVIMTVRDYLYDDCKQIVEIKYYEFALEELEPNAIKDILKKIFNVNDKFLDYILMVVRNNLRFAIMATRVLVIDKKTPESIDEIFDAYYKELISKTGIDSNEELKRTIAALSFFDSIDLRSKENNKAICSTFGINEENFLEMCSLAHEKEIADFYFDRMFIKISDQIFAEYLLYRYVFVYKKIDIYDLFRTYYKNRKQRFVQIIKAIVNVYYSDQSFDNQMNEFKNKVLNSNEQDLIISFFIIFAQLFIKESIDYSYQELTKCEIVIESSNSGFINHQRYSDLIDIFICNYGSKQYHYLVNSILSLLTKDNLRESLIDRIVLKCSIKNENFESCLCFYNELMKGIYKLAKRDDKYLAALFLIAKKVYPYEYEYNEFSDRHSLTFCRMILPLTPSYKETRKNMWESIYFLHKKSYDSKKINELIKDNFASSDINKHKKFDSEQVIQIVNQLDLEKSRDLVFAYCILNQFAKFESVKNVISSFPNNAESSLFYNYVFSKFTHRFGEEFKKALIDGCFKNYSSSQELADTLARLYQKYSAFDVWKINGIISDGFDYLFSIDLENYDKYLIRFLGINLDYSGNPSFLVEHVQDKNGFLSWVQNSSLKYKLNFVSAVLSLYGVDEINDLLYDFALDFYSGDYMKAETYWGNDNIVSLLNFEKFKKGFFHNLLEKSDINKIYSHFVESLFFEMSIETVFSLFLNDFELLKKVYFGLLINSKFYDHDSVFANFILEKDPSSLKEIIDLLIKGRVDIDRFNSLYYLPNFIETFINAIVTTRFSHINFAISYCVEKMPNDVFSNLSEAFIRKYKTNKNNMQEFSIIVGHRTIDSQIDFVDLLIKHKIKINIFRDMYLFDGPTSWTGSRIPFLQEHINAIKDYLHERTLPIEYKNEIESKVDRLNKNIKYEEIEEFNRGY